MNTRLQVEHCVTELVTGFDIVELMLRVAAGEKLSFTQKEVQLNGWAMESRIYAEDPSRGFLPSSGRINEYQEPSKGKHLRIDSGVYEGGDVSMFYDPMIAKLCSYGKTREEAIEYMKRGLSEFVISGVSHNISFLEALMAHPRFAKGDMSTNFIAEEYPDGFSGAALNDETSQVFLATAVHIYLQDAKRATQITGQLPGRERQIGNRWVVSLDGQNYSVYITTQDHGYDIRSEHNTLSVRSAWILGNNLFQGTLNGKQFSVKVAYYAGGMQLTYAGSKVRATVRTPRVAELNKFMPERDTSATVKHLEAPISGRVVKIKVKKGDVVKAGGELAILEAMKMENVIYAERDVTIGSILINEGDSVQADQVLIEFA
jgi:propionyl-CoA carboxylase alpha chain